MAIEVGQGDLARTKSIEPDTTYPDKLRIQLIWEIGGKKRIRSLEIGAEQFFGRGSYGAPLGGDAIINYIEHMRKKGMPPPVQR